MENMLKDKVALVTGASRGIGKAIAIALAHQGAKVAINYSSSDDAALEVYETIRKNGGTAEIFKAKVNVEEEVDSMFTAIEEKLGNVDILVNNAGITKDNLLMRMKTEEWDSVVDVNLKGAFLCTRRVLKGMMKARYGKIINISSVVGNLAGIDGAFADSENLKDSLAETWGYELFEYAHNNVCNRVLDSCFNGIYEACGTPPSSGRKCGNGQSQCPYNYNTYISVSNTGSYELDFIEPNTGYTASNSATCFGYTTASGDPYSNLRGPVADARRSIMQKYALDANADCDAYGEQLRTTAQNIGYQKVAAQQALQQKRLEFAQEEKETILSEATSAGTNFNECLSEIFDCYETQASSNTNWPDARIKTYCAQIANVPHCYETMICNPSTAQFRAVIDKQDNAQCNNSQDYTQNTCRNIVTLNEILNGVNGAGAVDTDTALCIGTDAEKCNSAALREQCLLNNGVEAIRTWKRADSSN